MCLGLPVVEKQSQSVKSVSWLFSRPGIIDKDNQYYYGLLNEPFIAIYSAFFEFLAKTFYDRNEQVMKWL